MHTKTERPNEDRKQIYIDEKGSGKELEFVGVDVGDWRQEADK